MEQYIPKSALVAEIERRIEDNKKDIEHASHKNLEDYFEGYEDALVLFKEKFLDSVETKDVSLDDDVDKILEANDWNFDKIDFYQFAKHFFELGLQAQKRESNMKAPEKIYLEAIYPDNGVLPNGLNYTPSPTDIEYIRADAFIEKAAEWLKELGSDALVEDFKNYMKGE